MAKGFSHESQNAQTVEWYTPPWVFEAMALQFDLDPCTPVGRVLEWIPAARRYTILDDGLTAPWAGLVWCNPPYGRETQRWLKRMGEHRNGVALVFARPDCQWFHDTVATATCILFLKSRIRFVSSDGRPSDSLGAGSMLVAWGDQAARALHGMAADGHGAIMDCAVSRAHSTRAEELV